jgi:hypothetical protein
VGAADADSTLSDRGEYGVAVSRVEKRPDLLVGPPELVKRLLDLGLGGVGPGTLSEPRHGQGEDRGCDEKRPT